MEDYPKWLEWPPQVPKPDAQDLATARSEMFQALSLYYEHVKHVIYVMTAITGVGFVVLKPGTEPPKGALNVFVGIAIAMLLPIIGVLSIGVIRRYYDVYVAALVFAVRAHHALGQSDVHPWITRTIVQARRSGAIDADAFIEWRATNPDDTFVGYKRILIALALAGFVMGIGVAWYGMTTLGIQPPAELAK